MQMFAAKIKAAKKLLLLLLASFSLAVSAPGKDAPQPLAAFSQQISMGNPPADKIPGIYILTLEPGAASDDFSRYAERAKQRGWKYHELRTGHNPQRTMPKEYAAILTMDE